MKQLILLVAFILFSSIGISAIEKWEDNKIYDGQNYSQVSIQSIISELKPGMVLIISEFHNIEKHHDNQFDFFLYHG